MTYISHFLIGVVASFLASLPTGPVNFAVIKATLNEGRRSAVMIALGSAAVELFYCLLGVLGSELVVDNDHIVTLIQLVSIPVLLLIGILTLRKEIPETEPEVPLKRARGFFWLGISLNILNPTLLPWWMSLATQLRRFDLLSDYREPLIVFSLGVAVGTFLLLNLISVITMRKKTALKRETRVLVNKIIGWVFIGFAVWVAWLVWCKNPTLEKLFPW